MKKEIYIIVFVQVLMTLFLLLAIYLLKPIEIKNTATTNNDAKLNLISSQLNQLQGEVVQLRTKIETNLIINSQKN